jgi:hypothetical protein
MAEVRGREAWEAIHIVRSPKGERTWNERRELLTSCNLTPFDLKYFLHSISTTTSPLHSGNVSEMISYDGKAILLLMCRRH